MPMVNDATPFVGGGSLDLQKRALARGGRMESKIAALKKKEPGMFERMMGGLGDIGGRLWEEAQKRPIGVKFGGGGGFGYAPPDPAGDEWKRTIEARKARLVPATAGEAGAVQSPDGSYWKPETKSPMFGSVFNQAGAGAENPVITQMRAKGASQAEIDAVKQLLGVTN